MGQHADAFTDITQGSNAIGENAKSGWKCTQGWDAVTGLGTPKFAQLQNVVRSACGGSPTPGPSPPSPPAPPSPPSPPSPPAPASSHYEHPPCRSDEVDVQVQGLAGSTCTPKCSGSTCPTDVPAGTTATPRCALQDSSTGDKYCALTCFLGGCPTGAKCEHVGLTGICMYPSDARAAKLLTPAPPSLVV